MKGGKKRHLSDEAVGYYSTIIVQHPDVYKWNCYQTHGFHLRRHGQVSMHRFIALTDGLERDESEQFNSKQSCGNEKKTG